METNVFHLEEIEKNLDAANRFDEETRNGCARDFLMTYLIIETFHALDDREEKLKEYLRHPMALRHEAVQAGATSRDDPLWNVSACMETVIQLEYLKTQDETVEIVANEVQRALTAFVDANMSPTEMQELRDIAIKNQK